jgi:hypothetical protein
MQVLIKNQIFETDSVNIRKIQVFLEKQKQRMKETFVCLEIERKSFPFIPLESFTHFKANSLCFSFA